MYAQNLQVNAAKIEGELIVGDSNNPLLHAVVDKENSSNEKVLIGGFRVNEKSLHSKNYITSFGEAPIDNIETSDIDESKGIYLGTDGIKLGTKFSVNDNGDLTANSGTIGGFNITDTSLNNVGGTSAIVLDETGIKLGNITADGNAPFVATSTGEIYASEGTFAGSIVASEAELTDIQVLTMSKNAKGAATFNKITATGINVAGRVESSKGYFFGTESNCGIKLVDGSTQKTAQRISLLIKSGVAEVGTIYKYYITISIKDSKPAVNDIDVKYTSAK